jgi:effector-binding domain-containing protein
MAAASGENPTMNLFRPSFGWLVALALFGVLLGAPSAAFAQAAKDASKDASKNAPAASDQTATTDEVFGEEIMMPERTLLMRRVRTSWDEAWASIVEALKDVRADAEKLKVKVNGNPLVIYRSTADDSFEFDAALPIEAAPATPPSEEGLQVGPARSGKALKFIYRGPFDAMDSTYELISNFIDSKKVNAEDLSIEEYISDPATTKPSEIVINIYMPLKK